MATPLVAVALVFRSRPAFDALTHVTSTVSLYADSSVEQPLHKACKFGSVALLDRIWNTTADLEPNGWGLWSVRNLLRSQKLYGKLQFSLCLLEAAKMNRLDIVRWLFERFPYGVRRKVIYEAAAAGALEILQFFCDNGTVVRLQEDNQFLGEDWDEERENWERGRYIRFGGEDTARAILAGHTELVKWMYATPQVLGAARNEFVALDAAFTTGNKELSEQIMDIIGEGVSGVTANGLQGAAVNGHVERLQWFQDNANFTEVGTGILLKAAEAGQLEVVQWIIDRDLKDDMLGYESGSYEYDTKRTGESSRRTYVTCLGGEASLAIHAAAINGHLEVAKYLYARVDKPRNQAEEDTEKRRVSQRIDELLWHFRSDTNTQKIIQKVSGETMMLAAERGFLDVVKWIYTEYHSDPTITLFWVRGEVDEWYGYSKDVDEVGDTFCSVVDAAAGKGHLAIVQYLLQVGGKTGDEQALKRRRTESKAAKSAAPTTAGCTTVAMDVAAAHGHLEVVQWLHSNCSQGCTTDAMDGAAGNGHLETVKWLHANRKEGCTTDAMDRAAGSGHLHVVKWLHEHRSEGCTTDAMNDAVYPGHFETLKWLHENRTEGCTDVAMEEGVFSGRLNILKWPHRHQLKCRRPFMDNAARGGHLRVLRWLFENMEEGFTSEAIRLAANYGHFETVLILHNIAQQGLAKGINVMDTEQSETMISAYYLDITATFWAPEYEEN
ncbi:hypothetical protein DVH05_024177 [Phytophthora capsici]|nr:hypothetical protein DVH05_024177 [Phytophthora capsici]